MSFTKEEYLEWKQQAITKEVFADLRQDRQALLDKFAAGATLGETSDETAQLTVRLLGEMAGLDHLLEKEYSDYND